MAEKKVPDHLDPKSGSGAAAEKHAKLAVSKVLNNLAGRKGSKRLSAYAGQTQRAWRLKAKRIRSAGIHL